MFVGRRHPLLPTFFPMIAKKIPHEDKAILVSRESYPVFQVKKHLEGRAVLVVMMEEPIVLGVGKEWYVAMLMRLKETFGAESNQCVLLYDPTDVRKVIWDTLFLWNNFGGVSMPIVYGLDDTLKEIELNLKEYNHPLILEEFYGEQTAT